jgi:hypothetical protein
MAIVQDKCATEPTLAAIVVVPDTYDTVRNTMCHLRAQTVAEQIEIVLVVPSHQQLQLDDSELACFHSWQVIEVGAVTSKARGFVTGIRHAHAPVVALTEDHSFPDANWAEVMIAAHQKPWAAVGPSMRNDNPNTMLSWADFYQAYGEWAQPILSGSVRHLPGHNSSYKREILLSYGNQLESLMEAENVLHRYMKAEGYELLLESKTCTSHLNFGTWSSWLPKRYYTGRQVASTWSKTWSWPRRLLFTIASSLIPWIRLWRIQRNVRRGQPTSFLLLLMPLLIVGLLIEGIGYMMGFAAGAGDSIEKTEKYEYHRINR